MNLLQERHELDGRKTYYSVHVSNLFGSNMLAISGASLQLMNVWLLSTIGRISWTLGGNRAVYWESCNIEGPLSSVTWFLDNICVPKAAPPNGQTSPVFAHAFFEYKMASNRKFHNSPNIQFWVAAYISYEVNLLFME